MLILRGSDKHGSGAYKAGRGSRTHNGIDIAAPARAILIAPVSGEVTKLGWPSDNIKKQHLRYIEVTDYFGNRHRCMYAAPTIKKGARVEKSITPIGIVQDLTEIYQEMINHIHYEVIDSSGRFRDPRTWL